jgi:hypothetical protein
MEALFLMTYGKFYLTAVTVNWGRKYDPGVFKRNVANVLRFTNKREHVVIFVQELDEEPDPAKEHKVFNSMLEPGTKKVFWRSHEPIILSPDFRVFDRRRVLTMGSGEEIGGPVGTGPRRYGVGCVAEYEGIRFALGNTHPHRRMPGHLRVELARRAGENIFGDMLRRYRRSHGGIPGIWGADFNDPVIPDFVAMERVAKDRGLDHLHYWNHAAGTSRITLKDKGSLNGTIDPHDPLWARFLMEKV